MGRMLGGSFDQLGMSPHSKVSRIARESSFGSARATTHFVLGATCSQNNRSVRILQHD